MKKVLIAISAVTLGVAIAAWLGSRFWSPDAVRSAAAAGWPPHGEPLDAVLRRYPPLPHNAASERFLALARHLTATEAASSFVRREIASDQAAIGNPPPLADVTAVRDLLLHEPLVWTRQGGIGDAATEERRVVQMNASRALVADALLRGREGDPFAWEDLRGVVILARSLDANPQIMARTASLTMLRSVTAVSWKMPLPAPTWLAELYGYDPLPSLFESFQYQAASYWSDGERLFPTKWLATSVEHDRRIAVSLSHETRCSVDPPMNDLGTDLRSVWQRAFRYRAEREAAANALRLRANEVFQATSRCSEGTWSYDGTMLRFSRDIPVTTTDSAMPLALQLR